MIRRSLTLLLLGTTLGCAAPPQESPRNVLLISLDAFRADRLSADGYFRPTTPFLDEFATEGTRFSRAFVNTHGTPPSHTTMLSSLYQETHRVGFQTDGPGTRNDNVPDEITMVQEILGDNGWHTCAATGGGYMSGVFGFSRGFDQFNDKSRTIEDGIAVLLQQLDAAPLGSEPVFAVFHTYEVHSPYLPPDDLRGRFLENEPSIEPINDVLVPIQGTAFKTLTDQDFEALAALYDAEVMHTDRQLRALFAALEERGFMDSALIIITSDHGEEFGDHGGLLHRVTLFEELLRIPLIVIGEGFQSGRVRPDLVSLVDIAPTILAFAGIEAPAVMEGLDLRIERGTEDWAGQRVFSQYTDLLYSVRTPRWKLIERHGPRPPLLFDLQRDPTERHSVAADHAELVESLQAELTVWREALPELNRSDEAPAELSEETVEELRALGYLH
jgi:arylsulfatase A-like enzyme